MATKLELNQYLSVNIMDKNKERDVLSQLFGAAEIINQISKSERMMRFPPMNLMIASPSSSHPNAYVCKKTIISIHWRLLLTS